MSRKHLFRANVKHIDKDGAVVWEAYDLPNIVHDEGEQHLLYAAFATGSGDWSVPGNYYVGLDDRAALAEADTLGSLDDEPVGDGYARSALSSAGTGAAGQDFVVSQPAAAYQFLTKDILFTAAGGDWVGARNMFICTHLNAVASAVGARLISSLALSASRTLANGESLTCTMTLGISE